MEGITIDKYTIISNTKLYLDSSTGSLYTLDDIKALSNVQDTASLFVEATFKYKLLNRELVLI